MKWLLDTDVIIQPAKKLGNASVQSWLEREQDDCGTSVIVVAQLAYWVETKQGKSRTLLSQWLEDLIEAMEGRILAVSLEVATLWAQQKWTLEKRGQPMPLEDSYLAATAQAYDLTLVTGNEKDFRHCGCRIFNPFQAGR